MIFREKKIPVRWVLFYKNPKNGIGQLGLIGIFESQLIAWQFAHSRFSFEEVNENLSVESTYSYTVIK